jgi:hypothetical protein
VLGGGVCNEREFYAKSNENGEDERRDEDLEPSEAFQLSVWPIKNTMMSVSAIERAHPATNEIWGMRPLIAIAVPMTS